MIRSIVNSLIKRKTSVVTEEIDKTLKEDTKTLSKAINELMNELIKVKKNGLLSQETNNTSGRN